MTIRLNCLIYDSLDRIFSRVSVKAPLTHNFMDTELKQYLDEQFKSVTTKEDLAQQTTTLKAYADEQTEKLAVIIANTIVKPMEKNFAELKDHKTVQEKVMTLEADMQKIKAALQLN